MEVNYYLGFWWLHRGAPRTEAQPVGLSPGEWKMNATFHSWLERDPYARLSSHVLAGHGQ